MIVPVKTVRDHDRLVPIGTAIAACISWVLIVDVFGRYVSTNHGPSTVSLDFRGSAYKTPLKSAHHQFPPGEFPELLGSGTDISANVSQIRRNK